MLWHIRKEKATASLKTPEIRAAAAPAAVSSGADWHFHIKGRTKETGADGFYFTGTICFRVPPDWLAVAGENATARRERRRVANVAARTDRELRAAATRLNWQQRTRPVALNVTDSPAPVSSCPNSRPGKM